ncbi:MAG: DinB family protein [Acidobacteria bacterium]|nr:DinB family protein [Acidobacteriota bacterium]
MKKMYWIFASLLLLAGNGITMAQADKPAAQRTASQVADEWITHSERQLVAVADAMPADKYSFVPTNGEFRGVRNFAKQVKHAAAVNYICAAGILGEQAPADAADERGPDSARTKAEIIKYLKDSFAYLHKAVATIDEKNVFEPVKSPFGQGKQTRIGLAAAALAHSSNHYGQLVEYLRMNGIVPPASQ